jgi:hypothetical protein
MTRPISPSEGARIEERLSGVAATPASRFEISAVLRRSFATVRERWLTFAVLVLVLHFAVSLATSLLVQPHYHAGDHDLAVFAWHVALVLSLVLVRCVSTAAVVAASLTRAQGVGDSLSAVAGSLPTLIPIWMAGEYSLVGGFYNDWTGFFSAWARSHQPDQLVSIVLSIDFVEIVIGLASVAMLGVLTPVVLGERRSLVSAIGRTWRLTSRARLRIVALYLIVMAVLVLVSFAATGIGVQMRLAGQTAVREVFQWVMTAIDDIAGAFWSVVAASAYLELRRVKEGEPAEEVAQVFA